MYANIYIKLIVDWQLFFLFHLRFSRLRQCNIITRCIDRIKLLTSDYVLELDQSFSVNFQSMHSE